MQNAKAGFGTAEAPCFPRCVISYFSAQIDVKSRIQDFPVSAERGDALPVYVAFNASVVFISIENGRVERFS